MHILLTNDDGFEAEGLRALYTVLARSHEVTVVAPETEHSGVGHAFTLNAPLSIRPIPPQAGMNGYIVDGTPSDCVKFAMGHLLTHMPDAVVAGLNVGENTGTSGWYSGTVAAAREGAFWRVQSFAFSVCEEARAHVAACAAWCPTILDTVRSICQNGFENPHNATFFNVNFPGCSPREWKGSRITRQSLAFFDDRYREELADGKRAYWLYGAKKDVELSEEYDSSALAGNWIAVTPLSFDATAHHALPHFRKLDTLRMDTTPRSDEL